MQTIVTNKDARSQRIEDAIKYAFQRCQEAASDGKTYQYVTVDRDIWRDVEEGLEKNHMIWIPSIISRYSPSRRAIEHSGEKTEMKLTWR